MGNSCCSSDDWLHGYKEVNTERNDATIDLSNDVELPLHICYKINGSDLKILESKQMYDALSSHSKASLINFGKKDALTDSFLFVLLIRWRYIVDDIINDRFFNLFDNDSKSMNSINYSSNNNNDTATANATNATANSNNHSNNKIAISKKFHIRRNSKLSLIQQLLTKPFHLDGKETINFANYIGETKLLPNIGVSEFAQGFEILGETYFYRFITQKTHKIGIKRFSFSAKQKSFSNGSDQSDSTNNKKNNININNSKMHNYNTLNANHSTSVSMLSTLMELDIISNKNEKKMDGKKFESLAIETINDLNQRIIEKEIEFCQEYWQKSNALMDQHYTELRNDIIKLNQQIEIIKYVTPKLKHATKHSDNNNNNNNHSKDNSKNNNNSNKNTINSVNNISTTVCG